MAVSFFLAVVVTFPSRLPLATQHYLRLFEKELSSECKVQTWVVIYLETSGIMDIVLTTAGLHI